MSNVLLIHLQWKLQVIDRKIWKSWWKVNFRLLVALPCIIDEGQLAHNNHQSLKMLQVVIGGFKSLFF